MRLSLFNSHCIYLFAWMSTICVSGCSGEERLIVVPAKGIVVLRGEPVAGVVVSFLREGATRPATGVTNNEGRFELMLDNATPGAYVGPNIVTVANLSRPPEAQQLEKALATAEAPDKSFTTLGMRHQSNVNKAKNVRRKIVEPKTIPAKYASLVNSGLTAEVKPEAPNDFRFELMP